MISASAPARTAIAVIGAEAECERWARALRGIEGVVASRVSSTDDGGQPSPAVASPAVASPPVVSPAGGLMAALSRDDIEAVAFASPIGDPAATIKRALMAGRHVLAASTGAIGERQLLALDALARRRNRVLMFDTGTLGDGRVDFVRRMTSGPQALWRPRYVRSMRTGAADGASIDEQAIADISFVLTLLGGAPARVSALSPRFDDESGASDAVFMTLAFERGAVARIDVSRIEPEPRHEVAVACDGRTVLLDTYNARAPMQIQSVARTRGAPPDGWSETVSEHPAAAPAEPLARAASAFVAAVRARDLAASNVPALAVATAVWEAARKSIAAGGRMTEIANAGEPPHRPALKLIVGGGQLDTSHPAPVLKLVASRPLAAPDPPEPEPLRTA